MAHKTPNRLTTNNQTSTKCATRRRVLAQAVLELYPAAKLGIRPPIEDGFYYDFDLGEDADGKPVTFKPRDLARIETDAQNHPAQLSV